MSYKLRQSESKDYPQQLEHLQEGILVRVDVKEKTTEPNNETETHYVYQEFWFPEGSSLDYIREVVVGLGYFFEPEI